jgi:outer membrane immunogenic protein
MLKSYSAFALIISIAPGAAMAADQVEYSAPIEVATSAFSWTGFYLGAHGGYNWSNSRYNHEETATVGGAAVNSERFDVDPSGLAGGVHVGYQHQWDHFLLGGELAYTFYDADDRAFTNLNAIARTRDSEIRDIWSVSAKAGYAWDRTLGYVKAGYANAKLSYVNTRISTGLVVGHSDDRVGGFLIGTGVEHALTDNWIVGVDYTFTKFSVGDQQQFNNGVAVLATNRDNHLTNHNVGLRLSYKF